MRNINLIVSRSRNNVISNAAGIPWFAKGEQILFEELTKGEVVIMGRKTFEDIGQPLPNRINIVVSGTTSFEMKTPDALLTTVHSLKDAIKKADEFGCSEIYIAGGCRLYEEAIISDIIDRMYITEIDIDVPVDHTTIFFPEFDKDDFVKVIGKTGGEEITYTRTLYKRKR